MSKHDEVIAYLQNTVRLYADSMMVDPMCRDAMNSHIAAAIACLEKDGEPDRPVTVDELRAAKKAAEGAFPHGFPVLRVRENGCSLELDCWPGGISGHTDAEFLAALRSAIEKAKKGKEK